MNGRDHGVRIGGQEPEQLMDALDRRALWAAHAFPRRPYPREGKQRRVLIQRKPGRSLARLRVGVLAEKSWPGPRIVRPAQPWPPVRAPDALTRRGASIPRRPRSSCCKEAGREDCPPRPLGSFPDGRGGGAARSVPGNSECNRRAPSIVTGPILRIIVSAGRRVHWLETRAQIRGCGSEDLAFGPSPHRSREVAGP